MICKLNNAIDFNQIFNTKLKFSKVFVNDVIYNIYAVPMQMHSTVHLRLINLFLFIVIFLFAVDLPCCARFEYENCSKI